MLTSLYIKNFALIDELDVTFNNGLTIITGETGAGKSILLGGLSLVLGKRADLSQIKDKGEKCVIEATFDVANYNLKGIYAALDLDYDVHTIIRREILPSGKSRAFVNDKPVVLESLSTLSSYLIDIHSQHQTQQLVEDSYQFKVIDALADNGKLIESYVTKLKEFKSLNFVVGELKSSKAELLKEYDYNNFLLNELNEIELDVLNLEDLEEQYETLSNVEDIQAKLSFIQALLTADDQGTLDQLQRLKQELTHISEFGKPFAALLERVESVTIELKDILTEVDALDGDLSSDPKELEVLSQKLQIVNNLLHKHGVAKVDELIVIKNDLDEKVGQTNNLDDRIAEKEKQLMQLTSELEEQSKAISKRRQSIVPKLTVQLEIILKDLGMPNAKFKINVTTADSFKANGKDQLEMLFTANKGSVFKPLKNSASGGELSRIMLAIKSILAEYIQLPSIMFDEIDTGVSGEIAHKMGGIMQNMSRKMQVFTITHLPQIAAKGNSHFKVFKKDKDQQTQTNLKKLNEEERLVEIAQMLGGLNITESAMAHAKELLN
ncbi:DNA repair protein RecN [Winogradskyella sp. DF17]|uniref:DNA repair protein RecN n=1 Tax=Winogradskyella pelagia TaxID=2819984 RepID=A0ABS3T3P6_9FLAO|nr:DNA repair protein RecN [Winogradskyella sp. DF17]